MISPTGKGQRDDTMGLGHYGASRGGRDHKGKDYLCEPGQDVYAPIDGQLKRIGQVYSDDSKYKLVEIQGKRMSVKLFYVIPLANLHGEMVKKGQFIGKAQDISKKYGTAMKPHVHLEITSFDPGVMENF